MRQLLVIQAIFLITTSETVIAQTLSVSTSMPVVAASDTAGPYAPTTESLKQWSTPEWIQDAKLGIFIHWGAYAVPAYGSEWYPRRMYQEYRTTPKGVVSKKKDPLFAYHRKTWGDQDKFGYKDFIPMFKAENWDPSSWAELFVKSGAKYIVPVAEHHDGFAMYDSSHTPWNSTDMGPKRDVLAELSVACSEAGLRFGVSSHYAWNWRYYTYEDRFDTVDPSYASLYSTPHPWEEKANDQFVEKWYNRTAEIIDKYQPEVLWFDFGLNYPEFTEARTRLAAYYYNRGVERNQEVVLQYKNMNWDPYPRGSAMLDIERGKMADIQELPWQTDTSVSSRSWGYIDDDAFKSSDSLIDDLADIVSKNGCLLLNVGPRADGTIPQKAQAVLLEIGEWLGVYGESIYGTRPWKVYGEGPTKVATGHHTEGNNKAFGPNDFRFTRKGDVIYAIGLAWPKQGEVNIASFGKEAGLLDDEVSTVELVGSDAKLVFTQQDQALVVQLPPASSEVPAYALRIRTGK